MPSEFWQIALAAIGSVVVGAAAFTRTTAIVECRIGLSFSLARLVRRDITRKRLALRAGRLLTGWGRAALNLREMPVRAVKSGVRLPYGPILRSMNRGGRQSAPVVAAGMSNCPARCRMKSSIGLEAAVLEVCGCQRSSGDGRCGKPAPTGLFHGQIWPKAGQGLDRLWRNSGVTTFFPWADAHSSRDQESRSLAVQPLRGVRRRSPPAP